MDSPQTIGVIMELKCVILRLKPGEKITKGQGKGRKGKKASLDEILGHVDVPNYEELAKFETELRTTGARSFLDF